MLTTTLYRPKHTLPLHLGNARAMLAPMHLNTQAQKAGLGQLTLAHLQTAGLCCCKDRTGSAVNSGVSSSIPVPLTQQVGHTVTRTASQTASCAMQYHGHSSANQGQSTQGTGKEREDVIKSNAHPHTTGRCGLGNLQQDPDLPRKFWDSHAYETCTPTET
jgi:hypothetical protein